MLTEIKSPAQCSDERLQLFQSFILQGSEVASAALMSKIKQAHKLIFVHQDNNPVAVSALRYSTMPYCQNIFEQAGVAQLLDQYAFEVSWAYTAPNVRGLKLGHQLMEIALAQAGGKKCFATAKEDNHAAHAIFKRFGLQRLGKPYNSQRGDYSLGLFAQP